MNWTLGIDPGLTGAVAAVSPTGVAELLEDLPTLERGRGRVRRELDAAALSRLLYPHAGGIRLAVVEQVSSRPGQGVASVFSLGHSLGTVQAVLASLSIPVVMATPTRWKRAVGVPADKERCRAFAARLHPDQPLERKRDHNRAEALLLARYARTLI